MSGTLLHLAAALSGCVAFGLAGCGATEAPLVLGAEDCWGTGADPCDGPSASVIAALGGESAPLPTAPESAPPVAMAATATAEPAPEPKAPPETTPDSAPAAGAPSAETAPAGPAGVTATEPPPTETTAAATSPDETAPTPSPPEPVASAQGCNIAALENADRLTAAQVLCLQQAATGASSASDPERQIAAIALYNTRTPGWGKAVDAALKRPALANAPLLNFAGIKPAYDSRRYTDVLARSRSVWRNLGKGYQLGPSDKTFLTEFACRSAGQLALSGKPANDGLDWCERWLDRASKAGQDTAAIEDLIEQLE